MSNSATPSTAACQGPLFTGILQAKVLEWVAMPSFTGSSQLRDRTQVSSTAGGFFTMWATQEALKTSKNLLNKINALTTLGVLWPCQKGGVFRSRKTMYQRYYHNQEYFILYIILLRYRGIAICFKIWKPILLFTFHIIFLTILRNLWLHISFKMIYVVSLVNLTGIT